MSICICRYVYICGYACACVCGCVCMYACMDMGTCAYLDVYACLSVCPFARSHLPTHTCISICICLHINVCVDECTHMCLFLHAYAYIHTYILYIHTYEFIHNLYIRMAYIHLHVQVVFVVLFAWLLAREQPSMWTWICCAGLVCGTVMISIKDVGGEISALALFIHFCVTLCGPLNTVALRRACMYLSSRSASVLLPSSQLSTIEVCVYVCICIYTLVYVCMCICVCVCVLLCVYL